MTSFLKSNTNFLSLGNTLFSPVKMGRLTKKLIFSDSTFLILVTKLIFKRLLN